MTNLLRLLLVPAALTAVTGCSDDAPPQPDAPDAIDAPIDAPDAPSRCGSDFFLTGEYADWDSTTAAFDGVEFATWTVRGEPARTITTAPNGRVEMCIGAADVSVIDATQPDYLSAIFMADPTVLQSPGQPFFLIKGLKTARAPTFYQGLGLTFEAGRAHVLVQKQGAAAPLTLTVDGAGVTTTFAADDGNDTSWTAGASGGLVLFANVDTAGSPALGILASSATLVGPSELQLEPGKLTIVTVR